MWRQRHATLKRILMTILLHIKSFNLNSCASVTISSTFKWSVASKRTEGTQNDQQKNKRVTSNTIRSNINFYLKMEWGSKNEYGKHKCQVGPKPVRRLSFQRFAALTDSFCASCEIYRRSTTSVPTTPRQCSWVRLHSFVKSLGTEIPIKFTISSMPDDIQQLLLL